MLMIDPKFGIGESVYLVTDKDQLKRLITAIKVCPDNSLLYECICGTIQSCHYDFELSTDQDTAMKVNI